MVYQAKNTANKIIRPFYAFLLLSITKPVLEEIKNISSPYIEEMRFPDYKKDVVDYTTRNVNADSDMLAK